MRPPDPTRPKFRPSPSSAKTLARAALAAALLAAPLQAATMFTVILDGSQEVGPVLTPATGIGTATLNDLGGGNFSLSYSITFSSHLNWGSSLAVTDDNGGAISVTAFHIHNAARGVNGGVVYGIYSPSHDADADVVATLNMDDSTTITGSWGPTDGNPAGNINTFATTFLAAAPGEDVPFYFNVHSTANTGGEIRGQIVAVPEPGVIALGIAGLVVAGLRRRPRT